MHSGVAFLHNDLNVTFQLKCHVEDTSGQSEQFFVKCNVVILRFRDICTVAGGNGTASSGPKELAASEVSLAKPSEPDDEVSGVLFLIFCTGFMPQRVHISQYPCDVTANTLERNT